MEELNKDYAFLALPSDLFQNSLTPPKKIFFENETKP